MEENITLVDGESTENAVEQPAEEVVVPEKIYTEEDLNNKIDSILPKKLNRREEKIRREYEKKYGELENILMSGLNVNSIEEATENLKSFYENKGVQVPKYHTSLSDKQEQILADAEADEMIESSSLDELRDEIRGLVEKGYENMSSSEKRVFSKVNEYVKREESKRELAAAGITSEELDNTEYIDFKSKLNPDLTEKEKYELYKQFKPKPKVTPMGSMKGITGQETGVKEFYSKEEAMAFSRADLDKNPKLVEAIEKSMLSW